MSVEALIKRIRTIMWKDKGIDGDVQRLAQLIWLIFLKIFDFKEEERELDDAYVPVVPDGYRWRDWANPEFVKDQITGQALLDFVNNRLFPVLRGQLVKNEKGAEELIFSRNDAAAKLVKTVMMEAINYSKDGTILRQVINELNSVDFSDSTEAHQFNVIYEELLSSLQSNAGEFYTTRAITSFCIEHIDPRIGMTVADFAAGTGGFLVDAIQYEMNQLEPGDVDGRAKILNSIQACEFKPLPFQLLVTNLILHGIEVPNVDPDSALRNRLSDYGTADCVDRIAMNPPYGGMTTKFEQMNFPEDMRSSESYDLFLQLIMKRLAKNGRVAVVLPDGFLFETGGAKSNIKKKLLSEFNLHTIIRLPSSCFAPYASIATNLLFFDRTTPTQEIWFYRLDMPAGYKHFSKTKPMRRSHFECVDQWWKNREEIKDVETDTFKAKKFSIDEIVSREYNLDCCGYPIKQKDVYTPLDTVLMYREQRENIENQLECAMENIELFLSGSDIDLLNIKTLTSELEELNKVFPKEFRTSVLKAAMKGELTSQREEDGSVDELLASIKKQKKKLIDERLIKAETHIEPVPKDDLPYDIPSNWRWARFEELISLKSGQDLESCDYNSANKGMIYLTGASNIDANDNIIINRWTERPKSIACKNDVLLSCKGTVGKVHILELENVHIARQFMAVRPYIVSSHFIRYFLLHYVSVLQEKSKGVIPGIERNDVLSALIAVPPLEEQDRIVKKLDKLLAAVL